MLSLEYYKQYFKDNGQPIKCIDCDSTNLKEENHVMIEVYVGEYDVVCADCGKILAHFAYGVFDSEMIDAKQYWDIKPDLDIANTIEQEF